MSHQVNEDPLGQFTELDVHPVIADGGWQRYIRNKAALRHGRITNVGNLPDGTAKGKPAFQVLATLDDGSQVIVETTWELMKGAVHVIEVSPYTKED